MPTSYPNDRKLKKAPKTSHVGLDAGRFMPVLEWLEERWSRDEASIVVDLQPDRRSFEGWLLALAQGFGDAMLTRDASTNASGAMTDAAIRRITGLGSLAELVASRVCDLEAIHLQLIVAWFWARGHTAASRRRLQEAQRLTGYTDTQIKNILEEAEPARSALAGVTRRRDLWRFGDACRLVLVNAPIDEDSGAAIERALRARDEGIALVRLAVGQANALMDAITVASAGDIFVILWSCTTSILWSRSAWVAEVAEAAARSRVFVVLAALNDEPSPEGLPVRDMIRLSPDVDRGVEAIVRIWRSDRAAEQESGRRIAPSRIASAGVSEGVTVYVASAHGEVYVPFNVLLEYPVGVLVTQLVKDWRLPTAFEILGRPTHHIRYALIHEERVLSLNRSLAAQGVGAGSLLELGFDYEEIGSARTRTEGYFRGDAEAGARKKNGERIRELVEAALLEAGLILS